MRNLDGKLSEKYKPLLILRNGQWQVFLRRFSTPVDLMNAACEAVNCKNKTGRWPTQRKHP